MSYMKELFAKEQDLKDLQPPVPDDSDWDAPDAVKPDTKET